jgi:hypothetical protein
VEHPEPDLAVQSDTLVLREHRGHASAGDVSVNRRRGWDVMGDKY